MRARLVVVVHATAARWLCGHRTAHGHSATRRWCDRGRNPSIRSILRTCTRTHAHVRGGTAKRHGSQHALVCVLPPRQGGGGWWVVVVV